MTIRTYPNGKHRAIIRLAGKVAEETFNSFEEAKNFEIRKRSEFLSLESKAVQDLIPDILFSQALEQYLSAITARKIKSESTIKGERTKGKSLVKYFGDLPVSKISSLDIQKYFDFRGTQPTYFNDGKTVRNENVTPDTLRLEKVVLSNVYKFLNKNLISLHNPVKSFAFELPSPTEDYDVINTEDLADMLKVNPKNWDSDILFNNWVNFTLHTAMRPGEASRLLVTDFDRDMKGFRIRSTSQKNRRAHFVSLSDDLIDTVEDLIIKAYAVNSPYVFYSYDIKGNVIPFNYSYYWRRKKIEVGITNPIKPHQLRHTAITMLARYGELTQHELMVVTGHTTFESLRRYLHLLAVEYRENVTKASNALEKAIVASFHEVATRRIEAKKEVA
jgi:integrase